ncbi:hypothetical protein Tco_0808832 [Tanacetum coccineum]
MLANRQAMQVERERIDAEIPRSLHESIESTMELIETRVRRLMQGIKLSDIDRESRFSNKFDQFTAEAEESLTSSEWYKYVTNVRLAKNLKDDSYDMLFDHLQQYEKLVIAFRAKRTAKTYDPLTLIMIYDYQGDTFSDDQDDNLTSAMMPLTRAVTQRYFTLINNRLRTSSNTRNQAVVQADRVNIQSRNVKNGGRITRRSYAILHQEMLQMFCAIIAMLNATMHGIV